MIRSKDIDFFQKNGFFHYRNFFSKKKIEIAKKWMYKQNPKNILKSWTETEPYVPISVYSVISEKKSPISDLSKDKKMLEVAEKLIEAPVYVWHSKVNMKAAWGGTVEYFHQDRVYWQDRGYPSDKMLSCMIIIDDHNQNNAGLQIFKKTHKLGFVNHVPFININGLSKFMIPPKILNKIDKNYEHIRIAAKSGDVFFFHSSLIHGSSHNSSSKNRMIILSQLNTVGNQPKNVKKNAVNFNLIRAKRELVEATRRYRWFKKKYKNQKKTNKILFSAPIPKEEKA
jgi:hypothetical protein